MRLAPRLVAGVLAAALLAACGGSGSSDANTTPPKSSQNADANQLQAINASFDLTPGPPRRFLLGLQMGDGRLIGYGTIAVSVHPEGATPTAASRAAFLPVPGSKPPFPIPSQPQIVTAAEGRGVYASQVNLTKPGLWVADVVADVSGVGNLTASTTFQVNTTHTAVAVGEKAPTTVNPTVAKRGKLPMSAVDSRAQGSSPVPDPILHDVVIPNALKAHRPLVVVVSTPAYCMSKFCGPVTDMVESFAKRDTSNVGYVHIEVWGNYENQQLNAAAADWIARGGGDANEPWVFVVGSDGVVKARFDNVVTAPELQRAITQYAK